MTAQEIKTKDFVGLSQGEIDDIYRKSSIGEIPNGDSQGIAIIWAGSALTRAIATLTKYLIWQGKDFRREQNFFLNKAGPFGFRAIKGEIYRGESWFCEGEEAIILDYSKTTLLLRRVREEIREIYPGFYLAQVYWGKKRLSNFTLDFN
ncbi:MAG: hypothetical protein VKL39_23280 [Leptolyngbyaceae bacterium]|nr:hypothetical protein [Leptolyngbyaceae bacterium]